MQRTFDVEIEGDGVAASVAAIQLSRAGLGVAMHLEGRRPQAVPHEILSPRARNLLQRLRLPEPSDATPCDGVLAVWGGGPTTWHDYVLTSADCGLAVKRATLQACLRQAASVAGTTFIQKNMRDALCSARAAPIRIIAHGRSKAADRCYQDKLIGLFMPCSGTSGSRLLVEAMRDGWFYVSPAAKEHSMLAFVTRPALVPADRLAKVRWLADLLASTRFIAEAVGTVDFNAIRGVDARVARSVAANRSNEVRLGDAALSLDPL